MFIMLIYNSLTLAFLIFSAHNQRLFAFLFTIAEKGNKTALRLNSLVSLSQNQTDEETV